MLQGRPTIRIRGPVAVLAGMAAFALSMLGCGKDSPTAPVDTGPDVGTVELEGGPAAEFTPFGSYIDISGRLVWVAAAPAGARSGEIRLWVTPSVTDTTKAIEVALFDAEGRWTTASPSGVAGCVVSGVKIAFENCALAGEDEGDGAAALTGTLWRPASLVTVPRVPEDVAAESRASGLEISWNAPEQIPGLTYRVYLAAESPVDPVGYTALADGRVFVAPLSPIAPTGLTPGLPYFAIVTAFNLAGESPPSAEVSAVPDGALPDLGSLLITGSGAGAFSGGRFLPQTAGPSLAAEGHTGAQFWFDERGSGATLVLGTDPADPTRIAYVIVWVGSEMWGTLPGGTPPGGAARDGYRYAVDGFSLPQIWGTSGAITLTGSLRALPVPSLGGSYGVLDQGGAWTPPNYEPDGRDFAGDGVRWSIGGDKALDVDLVHQAVGSSAVRLTLGTSVWELVSPSGPLAGVSVTGSSVTFSGVELAGPGGPRILTGTLTY